MKSIVNSSLLAATVVTLMTPAPLRAEEATVGSTTTPIESGAIVRLWLRPLESFTYGETRITRKEKGVVISKGTLQSIENDLAIVSASDVQLGFPRSHSFLRGTFVAASTDTLSVLDKTGKKPLILPLAGMTRVDVSRGTVLESPDRRIRRGLGVGLLAGSAAGVFAARNGTHVGIGLAGVLVGGAIGLALPVRRDDWEPVRIVGVEGAPSSLEMPAESEVRIGPEGRYGSEVGVGVGIRTSFPFASNGRFFEATNTLAYSLRGQQFSGRFPGKKRYTSEASLGFNYYPRASQGKTDIYLGACFMATLTAEERRSGAGGVLGARFGKRAFAEARFGPTTAVETFVMAVGASF